MIRGGATPGYIKERGLLNNISGRFGEYYDVASSTVTITCAYVTLMKCIPFCAYAVPEAIAKTGPAKTRPLANSFLLTKELPLTRD